MMRVVTTQSRRPLEKLEMKLAATAWRYFELHAGQRLKTFHFYIVMCLAALGGLVTLMQRECTSYFAVASISGLLAVLSMVFWRLDRRTRQLIWRAEEALMAIESHCDLRGLDSGPHELMLFTISETEPKRDRIPSYSRCLHAVMAVFWALGLIGVGVCYWLAGCPPILGVW
jgi:hypothetical protein